MTQIEQLKSDIEGGESHIYAFEQVDIELMIAEGNKDVAEKIKLVLNLVDEIDSAANIGIE